MEFYYEEYGEGLGQMKEIVDGIVAQATDKVRGIAAQAGEAMAKPVAEESKSQFKEYLPWLIIGFVAVSAMGGLFGGMGVTRRR